MKKALVTTTINMPYLLEDYCKDIQEHKHEGVSIIVAGDKKTPPSAAALCNKLDGKYGVPILYMNPTFQEVFLKSKCPKYGAFLPYNCIQRRNVAILFAYAEGAEIIYTIDDDNFLHTKDYIGSHGKLGTIESLTKVYSDSGWFNVCEYLAAKRKEVFYHRGFPFKQRGLPKNIETSQSAAVNCVVNAGLWLGDPDIDAVTRLALSPEVVAFNSTSRFALDRGVKSPFNSQNTALHRSVVPAYCLIHGVGRYDDIIASYVVTRIAEHLGDYISFGLPLVNQKRNQHDLWKDLVQERLGMQLIDQIVDYFYKIKLTKSTYWGCANELMFKFRALVIKDLKKFNEEQRKFLTAISDNYTLWLDAINKLYYTQS